MARASFYAALATIALSPWSCMAAGPKVIDLEFFKVPREFANSTTNSTLARRTEAVAVGLFNIGYMYVVNISLGTPPQNISVALDTGSSDLWVPSTRSDLCTTVHKSCKEYGAFNPHKSSTTDFTNASPFNIEYMDYSSYRGTFIRDTFGIGQVTIPGATIALVEAWENTMDNTGVWGLSFPRLTVDHSSHGHPSILEQMRQRGLINTIAYSLWLNGLSGVDGSIIFGGVDSGKYEEPLVGLPILSIEDNQDWPVVGLTSLSLDAPDGVFVPLAENTVVPAMLDSGSALTYLPDYIAQKIYDTFDVTVHRTSPGDSALPLVACSIVTTKAGLNVTFGFGGPGDLRISVPISELVIHYEELGVLADGSEACFFGIVSNAMYSQFDSSIATLGDTFLRSAYVVYDLERKLIGLAQSRVNSTVSDIREITDDTLPHPAPKPKTPISPTGLDDGCQSGLATTTRALGMLTTYVVCGGIVLLFLMFGSSCLLL